MRLTSHKVKLSLVQAAACLASGVAYACNIDAYYKCMRSCNGDGSYQTSWSGYLDGCKAISQ